MILIVLHGYVIEFKELIDQIRMKILEKFPDLFRGNPTLRRLLINQGDMDQRVTYLWSIFREEVRNGFKRRRIDKDQELI